MLKKGIVFILLIQGVIGFSQQLEESIYAATEIFNTNQNPATFQELNKKSIDFKDRIVSKDEQLAFVFLQCNVGYYLKGINSSEAAISSYENAGKLYSENKLSGYDMIEYCLKPLGELYTVTKDYTNAENIIKQYLFLAEETNNSNQIVAGIINLSILYQLIDKHQDVLKLVNEALDSRVMDNIQKQKLINIKIRSQITLSEIESISEIPKSNSYQYYMSSAQLALQNENFEEARINFEKYKKLFLKQEVISARMLSKLYVSEASFFIKLNDTKTALKSLSDALKSLLPNFNGKGLPRLDDLYAENTFIDIFDLLGDLQLNSKNALKSYDLSFYIADLLNENITSQEAKVLNQIDNRIRSEKCLALLYQEYENTSDIQFLSLAFQYAENSKVVVLKEMVQKKTLLELYPNDSLFIKERQLLQQQETITNELIKEQLGHERASVLNDLSKLLSDVSTQLKKIKKEIKKVHPKEEKRIISILDLKIRLQEDQAVLLEYFYGKHAIYQFVIDGDSMGFYKIDLNDQTKLVISKFIDFFDNASAINNDIKNFTSQAFQTYKFLNLEKTGAIDNLIIIPDGLLNFIPFESLLTGKTKTSIFSKMPFLLRSKKIIYNSSAQFYLKEKTVVKDRQILGVFPVFENTNQELRYSIEEANSIKNEMNTMLLMNGNATKANFIKNASEYNILHLSTHARSGDFNINASIEFYDDTMFLNELYSLDLNPELVVLSACETGVARLQKGEGAMSIARGFQYAGATNILFSLWQINDQSTSKIMQVFYKKLNKHGSIFIANHDSKLEYLDDNTISNIKKSPYYWSAFMYYGEVTKPITRNYTISIIGLCILLTLIFVILKFKRI